GRVTDRARARRASRRASRGRRRGGAATARCARATPPRIAMGLRNAKQSGPGLARAPDMKLVRARWWGAAAGVVLAVVDTLTISALGVRFEMNGHHVRQLVGLAFGSACALVAVLARPLRVEARSVSVHELFDRALLLAHEELQGKALRVQRDESPLLPEVRADGDLICQVLLGLLANAAEAAPSGGEVALAAA